MIKMKKAFTLSEVMLVLSVIGVIAALTIPGIVQNLNDRHLKVQLKKSYSELSSVANMIKDENDGSFVGAFSSITDFRDKFAQKMSVSKKCDYSPGNCWYTNGDGSWKYYDNNPVTGLTIGNGLILSNGTLLNFLILDSSCNANNYLKSSIACGWIISDVNGFKQPNTVGKDIFYFYVTKDKFIPWGGPDSLSSVCSIPGYYCTASKLAE